MLGDILRDLTNPASAETALATLGRPDLVALVQREAASAGVTAGILVATRFRHMLDHAGEEVWLDLLGRMSGSPQPGLAALEAMLSQSFPHEAPAFCCEHVKISPSGYDL